MNQPTHAWIAVRAVALLEDADSGLAKLLAPSVQAAAIGAWIPDLTDGKRGGGQTQHHVLKMVPYDGPGKQRFVAKKADLLKRLSGSAAVKAYLEDTPLLPKAWWSQPYKADPGPGQHLANRAMAIATMLRDLLVIGSKDVDKLVPGAVKFLKDMDEDALTRQDQAALYFFMLSHFIADACMPCHCDGRALAGFSAGLHEELEEHWGKEVGREFNKKTLLGTGGSSKELLALARNVDEVVGLKLSKRVPDMKKGRDVWLEVVDMCRASFALNAVIAPPEKYPYNGKGKAPFAKVLEKDPDLLAAVDRVVLADAVVNTAMVWSHIWDQVRR